MTSARVPDEEAIAIDQFPMKGLGFYDSTESSAHFNSYIWTGWTRQDVRQMQVDQDLLDQRALDSDEQGPAARPEKKQNPQTPLISRKARQ